MTVDSTEDDLVAREALIRYDFSARTDIRMINLSENATYLVHDPTTGRDGILRVHREGYHPVRSIESELMWLDALRRDAGVETPISVRARDGARVITVHRESRQRHAVLFEKIGGIEPDEDAVCATDFKTLGALTARLHRHARTWRRPRQFHRFSWDWDHTLGKQPRWGRWQDGIGIGIGELSHLSEVATLIGQRLRAYGASADRFGLVHADLRLANLLVDDGHINVIDFDDSGFSWYLYDFGSAVSFIEDDPRLPEWRSAWIAGYRDVATLTSEEEQMLDTFVMLRRFMLVAWMGSHSHAREVQEKGSDYTAGTCELGERYLSSSGASI
ncbi:phosphotransferase enzyme family protein [Leekyejoonella antrihumi]|uniref:Aminoglycoside phosphotransferase n=1 Tax=Leekyejoonella antrihumi TaxID=1660198 RepID=A0A563DQW9_9MICO|nr:phosphotransferase [Leekyejoonella antrihumi]TWP32688.1 aminoglycoside phosphotransferase [Leekyejoonella antrihumi]